MSPRFTIDQAAWAAGARVVQGTASFDGVFTDTRKPVPGALFVALRGENHDAHDHLADAVAKGAKVRAGGRRNPAYPGLYYEPTLLTDVTHEMEVMRDETFGPVIPIMKVADEEEAIRLANDSPYGLGASVFTRDAARGRAIARRIEAGGICVNDTIVHFAVTDLPMGGVKESGIGRRHAAEGIRKFCYQKSVVVDRFGLKSEFNWFPNTAAKLKGLKRVMNLLYRSGWRRKLFG
jgi:hypothetical protein